MKVKLSSFSRLLIYRSYRSYRNATRLNNVLLLLFGICLILSLFPINKDSQVVLSSVGFLAMMIFLIRFYWVESKKRKMVALSKEAKQRLGLVSKNLNLFDGALEIDGVPTVEISLFPETTILGSFVQMLRASKRNKPIDDEIQDIKLYVSGLERLGDQYYVYSTLPDEFVESLFDEGVTAIALPRSYSNKPSRLSYAAYKHDIRYALRDYPVFNAYQLTSSHPKNSKFN